MMPPGEPEPIDWKALFRPRNLIIWAVIIGAIVMWWTRDQYDQFKFKGRTMGTSYTVKYWANEKIRPRAISSLVNKKLNEINKSVSTWDKTSKITEFNNLQNTNWFTVDKFFIDMVVIANNICLSTNGAFDITISPLINMWGFDAQGKIVKSPEQTKLDAVDKYIGCDKISINLSLRKIRKANKNVTINLSAIAKGGAVNAIGKLLESKGIENYLVEIGGEVSVRGKKIDGSNWKVGIEQPHGDKSIRKILVLKNQTLATSGDYNNYFEEDGVRYSHIINPQTKRPIKHNLASVSVVSKSNALSDGLATAIMVMGEKDGMKYAKENDLSVYMTVRKNGEFVDISSPKWRKQFGK